MADKLQCSHILCSKLTKAQEALAELNKGESFAKTAEKYSECPSRKRGGDLGLFGRGQMVKEFQEAAFALKPGETTKELVKTQFGYHIIKRIK